MLLQPLIRLLSKTSHILIGNNTIPHSPLLQLCGHLDDLVLVTSYRTGVLDDGEHHVHSLLIVHLHVLIHHVQLCLCSCSVDGKTPYSSSSNHTSSDKRFPFPQFPEILAVLHHPCSRLLGLEQLAALSSTNVYVLWASPACAGGLDWPCLTFPVPVPNWEVPSLDMAFIWL